jgi:hypothetical protein
VLLERRHGATGHEDVGPRTRVHGTTSPAEVPSFIDDEIPFVSGGVDHIAVRNLRARSLGDFLAGPPLKTVGAAAAVSGSVTDGAPKRL